MTVIQTEPVPEGFELLPDGLGFTDNLQPCYVYQTKEALLLGLQVQDQHCNSMGICHGGAIMTLADIAAACWANRERGELVGSPTINLSIDFISAARKGQWLQAELEGVSTKRLFGFSRGVLTSSRGIVARFNATFYFPEHDGMGQDGMLKPTVLKSIS